MKVLGLLSGTSADGVDAALLEVGPPGAGGRPADVGRPGADADGGAAGVRLLAYRECPFPAEIRERILEAAGNRGSTRDVALLRVELADRFGHAAAALLEEAGTAPGEVAALGCHGQTVWHEPGREGGGSTLQLVDPARLAALSGVPVVHDFRSADVAAGGQGAPLVPWSDRILFSRPDESLVLQNLGGMGNLTWLPPEGSSDEPVAFDTGPGNVLLDAGAALATGGGLDRDVNGELARRGRVDTVLRDRILSHPFFSQAPPRSTGREVFGAALVETLARERGLDPGSRPAGGLQGQGGEAVPPPDPWADLMATLAAVTVESVVRSVRAWLPPGAVDRVVITGGGAHNPVLVEGLRAAFGDTPVSAGPGSLPVDPDAREAACFALLAWAFLHGVPGSLPGCTGAREARVLGSWTPAPGRPCPPEGTADRRGAGS